MKLGQPTPEDLLILRQMLTERGENEQLLTKRCNALVARVEGLQDLLDAERARCRALEEAVERLTSQ